MNLVQLLDAHTQWDELAVIGRGKDEGEAVSELVGMTRKGGEVRLYALQFDGAAREAQLRAEEERLCHPPRRKRGTRRDDLENWEPAPHFPFGRLNSIRIGSRSFEITGGSQSLAVQEDWEKLVLLSEFLRCGYRPCETLACRELSDLTLTEYELRGVHRRLPRIGNRPLAVTAAPDSRTHCCRKRLRLAVGQGSARPYVLTDASSGSRCRFYIESLFLSDPWEETEKVFRDPRFLERMDAQGMEELKQRYFGMLSGFCPKGMFLPVVEYEAEDEVSLEFYQTEWLNTPHDPSSGEGASGMIFLMKPQHSEGRHGLPLKAAAVHSPVPGETGVLNLEVLRWHERSEQRNWTL